MPHPREHARAIVDLRVEHGQDGLEQVAGGPGAVVDQQHAVDADAGRPQLGDRDRACRSLIFGMRLPPARSRYMSRSRLRRRTVSGGGSPPCRLIQ